MQVRLMSNVFTSDNGLCFYDQCKWLHTFIGGQTCEQKPIVCEVLMYLPYKNDVMIYLSIHDQSNDLNFYRFKYKLQYTKSENKYVLMFLDV